jgi:hypothetical protein
MHDFANYNKGTKYLEKGNFEKAVIFLKRELAINEFKECWLNLGNAYKRLGKMLDAFKCYQKAASDIPYANGSFGEYSLAYSNLGLMYYAFGDDDKAIEYYRKALDLEPSLADAIWNYSSALLRKHCSGVGVDIESAWQMYEFRFKRSNAVSIQNDTEMWDGISFVDKIVVLAEQGFGDKIMFGRYIHCLKEYCNEVWVQCPPTLDSVFSDFKICRDARESGGYGFPICSLAGRFGMVDGEWLRGKYSARDFYPLDLNVGVEWAGSKTHANDLNRSVLPNRFTDMVKVDGSTLGTGLSCVKLYSFRDKAIKGIYPLACKTWEDTGKALAGLDLLITVDTSVAHMAGSMGVETWLLQPSVETDFRWGHGEKSIWYPSVTIIQNNGNWDKVFAKVREMLISRGLEMRAKKLEKVLNAKNG